MVDDKKPDLWANSEHASPLEEAAGPDPWESAQHNSVSEDGHWEYWVRKGMNEGKGDAAFNNLDYKPVSVMMPVPEKDDKPYWGWFKKGTH